jgi:hypothetical protein
MPRISMFFGIVVYMYYDDHYPPHFHALYEGSEAMFDFEGNIIKGFYREELCNLLKNGLNFMKKNLRKIGRKQKNLCP